MKSVIAFVLVLVSLNCLAAAGEYDPAVLVKEQPSDYTRYLESLFKTEPELSVQKVTAKPRLKKGTSADSYRTEIRNQSRVKEANFAGEWVLVVVGQGTGAFRYFLTNAKTGKVIDPDLMTTNGKPLFVANRSLLVISGSVGEKTLEDAGKGVYGGPKAFVWKNERFEPRSL